MYLTAEKFGIPLEAFPAHIKELKNRIESLLRDISYWRSEKQAALEKCQTTEKLLEEFQMGRPIFDANQRLKQELKQATNDRDKYKLACGNEREKKWSGLFLNHSWKKLREKWDIGTVVIQVKSNV
jgi:hypothetical protein